MGCHCLCGFNHPAVRGCCTGMATRSLRFDSQLTGPVDVAMCLSCEVATIAHRDSGPMANAPRPSATETSSSKEEASP